MNELLGIINIASFGTMLCFVFWAIVMVLFAWTVLSIIVRFICSIMRHIYTKRQNDKVFKELGFNPKH